MQDGRCSRSANACQIDCKYGEVDAGGCGEVRKSEVESRRARGEAWWAKE